MRRGTSHGRVGIPTEDPLMRPLRLPVAALAAAALLAACVGETAPGESTQDIPFAQEEDTATPDPTAAPTEDPADGREPEEAADEPEPEAEESEPPSEVELVAEVVASGLEAPWDVVFADGRAFLTERDRGTILELDDDGGTTEVAALPIDANGEGGLLGLIADPIADGLGFLAYVTTSEDNRVVRFAPGGEPVPVLTGIPSARIHNGGRLAVGPDDMLYVATGDAGVPERAQDPSSLAGKILRVTPDGDIPDDNPIAGSPMWSMGHRNVQGLAFTAEGDLYAAEFGPNVDDEVNLIVPEGNYGWPEVTGEAGVEGFIDPVFVRQPAEASWSGLAVLTDSAIPQWEGDLFVAALRGERLWRLQLDDAGEVAADDELLVSELGRLRQAVQAPDGSLWVLTSNRDGRGSPVEADDRIVRIGPPT